MLQDDLEELVHYVPCDINKNENFDYINYISRAVTLNGDSELYTLAYFAFHILWLSFLQKTTYLLYKQDPEGVKDAFSHDGNTISGLQSAHNLYDLSVISEKKLCNIAKHSSIGWHRNKIDNIIHLIDERDHIAHCSGVLDLEPEDIEDLAKKCLRYTKDINKKIAPVVIERWQSHLSRTRPTVEAGGYALVHDWVVNYMSEECLSVKDIELILDTPLLYSDNFERIARMQLALKAEDLDTSIKYGADTLRESLEKSADEDLKTQIIDELEAHMQFR